MSLATVLFRQEIAIAFTIIAYFMLKKKKLFLFILLVGIASLFHFSALLFLIVYPVAYKKLSKIHILIAIISIIFFLFGESLFREIITNLFKEDYYLRYATRTVTLNYTLFVMQLLLFLFSLIKYKQIIEKEPNSIILYNLCFIGLVFQLFSSVIAEMFRISYYFSFYNLILFPLVLTSITKYSKSNNIIKYIIIILLIFYITFKRILHLF